MKIFKAKRVGDKDLLAFCNDLGSELGGGGKDGLKFGIEKNKDGTESIWLFGRRLQEWQEPQDTEETPEETTDEPEAEED